MNNKKYDSDVIVVGGGPIGLASALFCAKDGKSVRVIEKFHFGNQEGSSAEHVRMWRIMYTELNHAKLAIKAGDMFKELEIEADAKLLHINGLLNFGTETEYTPEGTLETAIQVMDELGKKYTRFDRNKLERLFPFKNLPDSYYGVFQEDGATIDVKKTIETFVKLNRMYGVDLTTDESVIDIKTDANGVEIQTNKSIYHAKKAIITPGPYVNEILKPSFNFELNILLWEMCFAYYKVIDESLNFPMWFQFDHQDSKGYSRLFYGFPNVEFGRKGYVRLAVDWASHTFTDIKDRVYVPKEIDIQLTQNYVRNHMRGVSPAAIDMGSALMTHLPDNLSVLDFLPAQHVNYNKNVVLCTAGWAFKFAPLFGKICCDLAVHGVTDEDISELSIERPGVLISPN